MEERPGSAAAAVAARLDATPDTATSAETLDSLRALLPDPDLHPVLRGLYVAHPSPRVRFHAEHAVLALPPRPSPVSLSDPPTPAEIDRALVSDEPAGRLVGALALTHLPRDAGAPRLLAAIQAPEPDPWVLAALLSVLGKVGGPEAAEEAAVHLDHPAPRVAANALLALHRLDPGTAVHAATYRLESPDERMRAHALRALYPFNQEATWARVRDLAGDEAAWMRAAAARLAGLLGHPQGERLLLEILRRETCPAVTLQVVEDLGRIGTGRARESLRLLAAATPPPLGPAAAASLAQVDARHPPAGHPPGDAPAADGPPANHAQRDRRAGAAPPPAPDPGGAASLYQPAELVAELLEDPDVAPPDHPDPALADAVASLRAGAPTRAIELVQPLLPAGGGAVPPAVSWTLAMAFLASGEVGLAGQHLRRLDLPSLSSPGAYALGRALEEMGGIEGAAAVYASLRERGYRDARARLAAVSRRKRRLPEHVSVALARDYRDLALLGRGGMGLVYRATRREGGESVALKVPDERLLADPGTLERFRREVESLAALSHPHVIRILDIGLAEVPFYAMELMPGRSLADLIEARAPLPAPEALGLLTPIASGLAAVHATGIVHRDLKPSNILLDPDGRPLLADFGVAYVDQEESVTSMGRVVGTPGYMAPEQFGGEAPTPAADVYALGASLFEALTGSLPFPEGSATLKIYQDPPALRTRAPAASAALEALVAACLARAPEDRPCDGAELEAALRAL